MTRFWKNILWFIFFEALVVLVLWLILHFFM